MAALCGEAEGRTLAQGAPVSVEQNSSSTCTARFSGVGFFFSGTLKFFSITHFN